MIERREQIRWIEKSCDPWAEIARRELSCAFPSVTAALNIAIIPTLFVYRCYFHSLLQSVLFNSSLNISYDFLHPVLASLFAYSINDAIPFRQLAFFPPSICIYPAAQQNFGHHLKFSFPCFLPCVWSHRTSELAGTVWYIRAILPFTGRKLRPREGQGLAYGLLLEELGVLWECHLNWISLSASQLQKLPKHNTF